MLPLSTLYKKVTSASDLLFSSDMRFNFFKQMSQEKRRSLADVTFLYKVLNGNIDIDISKIIDFHSKADRFSLRAKDSLTLKKK